MSRSGNTAPPSNSLGYTCITTAFNEWLQPNIIDTIVRISFYLLRTSYLESDAVHVSRCIVDLHDRSATDQLHATVRDGGHVTIVGANCFSAVELAARLSRTSHLSPRAGSQVTLLFPAFGPLASVLPRYSDKDSAPWIAWDADSSMLLYSLYGTGTYLKLTSSD